MKNIIIQEKLMLWLTFNPVLALTGCRTTGHQSVLRKQIAQAKDVIPLGKMLKSCSLERKLLKLCSKTETKKSIALFLYFV